MGIYDREYYSDERQPGFNLGGGRMLVTNLVLINFAIYLVDYFTSTKISLGPEGTYRVSALGKYFALESNLLVEPWKAWQLLTYGFLHDLNGISHILGNMVGLWVLGREVELKYGRKQFLQFYLSTIVLAGLGWVLFEAAMAGSLDLKGMCIGASGGVFGVVTVFIFSFPHRTLYLWAIVPIPAWGLGVMYAIWTVVDVHTPPPPGQQGPSVAHSAHIVGAACGLLFFYKGWQLGALLPRGFSLSALNPKPKIRIHDPDAKQRQAADKMSAEVDQILEKISREGEASLTARERKKLQDASRKYQQRDP